MLHQTTYLLLIMAPFWFVLEANDHTNLLVLEREVFHWRLYDRPEMASAMGYYRSNDRLEDFSIEAMEDRVEHTKYFQGKLSLIDKSQLSKRDQVDYIILKDMLDTYVEGYKWSKWNYLNPLSWLEGNQRDYVIFVESTPFDNRGDFENYLVRLNELPRLFDEYIALFDEAIALERTSHNVSVGRVPIQISEILKPAVEDSVYYSPIVDFLDMFNDTITPADRSQIKERGKKAVRRLNKAYEKLKNFLERIYLPQTRSDIGLGSLQSGKDYYKACLKWYLSLDITPEQVHQRGLEEVERIVTEMKAIMARQGYSGYSIRDYFVEINKKPGFVLEDEDEIVAAYEEKIKRIEPIVSAWFRDHPSLPIKVVPMHSDGPRGQYLSGTADGTRPGIFFANTFRPIPTYTMMTLAMHESIPGHHLQHGYAMTSDLASFRSLGDSEKFRVPFAFPTYTAYMEGWALYAESLGVEMNIFKDDYELMGYYDSEIWRACRLVVDTGIHYFGWSKQKAIDFLRNHTSDREDAVEIEIDRYITWPGHATAYKVGELVIKELRVKAQKQLGQAFDVRDFHMVILKNGFVPLHVLEAEVLEWVKNHDNETESEDCDCPVPGAKARCQRSSARRSSQEYKIQATEAKVTESRNSCIPHKADIWNVLGVLSTVLIYSLGHSIS